MGRETNNNTRDTGIAVHAALSELAGLYVEEVSGA